MKKLLPYGNHHISDEDIKAVIDVLKSDRLTTGPVVDQFEDALKKGFGAKNVSVVSNGTAALHLSALAMGWQKGDIVITTPITFLATANCIVYAGSTPDFVDINPFNYTIDIDSLEQKIKYYRKKGKKVKAVIGVDYAGHPCNWEALRLLADTYEFQLINDNCHALGAEYRHNQHYAVKYADIVTQSFHPVKNITTGEGGAVITNNNEYHNKVRQLRTHGITYDVQSIGKDVGPWYREMVELGYNYRLTDIQSALGISQYKRLNKRIRRRIEIAKKYDEALSSFEEFITPHVSEDFQHAYHLYALQIRFNKNSFDKKNLFEQMLNKGIQLQVHYIPIHLNSYYQKVYGFKDGDYPNAEKFYERQISLPIFPQLKNIEVDYIINSLIKFIQA